MIQNLLRLFVGAVLVSALALACMNIEFAPTFVPKRAPSLPLRTYLDGNIGVVRGDYYHFYQFIAYRHLTGLGLDERERETLAPRRFDPNAGQRPTAFDQWLKIRSEVRPQSDADWHYQYKAVTRGSWQSFLNCPDHAYETAARTLRERIEKFGPDSREVGVWLDGQDAVFQNCIDGENIPKPLGADFHPLLRQDRAYQIAAARFYAGYFDEAARDFEAVAEDADSPWAKWGKYLAARCWIRKGTLVPGIGNFDAASLKEAARRLRLVLDDRRAAHVHASARELLGYVQLRLDPEARAAQLAEQLTSETSVERINQAWIDFDYLLDRGHGREKNNDLGLWMDALRGRGDALQAALVKHRQSQRTHWLLAALSLIDAQHPEVASLLNAALEVPESHPGYVSVSYHRFRLLIERGAVEEGRRGLDQLLGNPKLSLPASARNQMLSLRFGASRDLEEILRFAPRRPADLRFWGARLGTDAYFDEDSLVVFNTALPLELLEEAAANPVLPANTRKELALATWVRAVLLGETEVAQRLAPVVATHWPELGPELSQLAAYETPEEKHFARVYLLLRHPGMQPHLRESLHRKVALDRIDDFRENWWCRLSPEEPMHESGGLQRSHWQFRTVDWDPHPDWPRALPELDFLSPSQRRQANRQQEKLQSIPTGPNYLAGETLAWADKHPDDPRVPHALHLAVRATRYGCNDLQTSRYSQRAFQLLHRRYRDSKWAKATKYWY